MMTEDQILYQAGPYWVCKAKHGYEVYKDGVTHATRCAIIGFEGEKGLTRAKAEADRRHQQERGKPMVEIKEDGTHYLADHHSGTKIEVWWSNEPECVGWVGRLCPGGHIQVLNKGEFTILEEISYGGENARQ